MSNWEKTMKEWDDSVPDGIKYLSAEKQVLMRRVRELESENARLKDAQRWIPVSERLPENGKLVLVIIAQKNVTFGQYFPNVEAWLVYRPDVGRDIRFWVIGSTKYNVTHWMPLPTPPEVQE